MCNCNDETRFTKREPELQLPSFDGLNIAFNRIYTNKLLRYANSHAIKEGSVPRKTGFYQPYAPVHSSVNHGEKTVKLKDPLQDFYFLSW